MSIKNRFWDWAENTIDWIFDRLGVHDIEDTSDMEQYLREVDSRPPTKPVDMCYPTLPNNVKQVTQEVKKIRQDADAPDLFIGKFIKDDRAITCEVIACTEDDFRIMILKIHWDRLGTYMDVGKTYPLRRTYQSQNGEMTIWEVDPETMKRDTSQVLLAWEKGIGWTFDLDM